MRPEIVIEIQNEIRIVKIQFLCKWAIWKETSDDNSRFRTWCRVGWIYVRTNTSAHDTLQHTTTIYLFLSIYTCVRSSVEPWANPPPQEIHLPATLRNRPATQRNNEYSVESGQYTFGQVHPRHSATYCYNSLSFEYIYLFLGLESSLGRIHPRRRYICPQHSATHNNGSNVESGDYMFGRICPRHLQNTATIHPVRSIYYF